MSEKRYIFSISSLAGDKSNMANFCYKGFVYQDDIFILIEDARPPLSLQFHGEATVLMNIQMTTSC